MLFLCDAKTTSGAMTAREIRSVANIVILVGDLNAVHSDCDLSKSDISKIEAFKRFSRHGLIVSNHSFSSSFPL